MTHRLLPLSILLLCLTCSCSHGRAYRTPTQQAPEPYRAQHNSIPTQHQHQRARRSTPQTVRPVPTHWTAYSTIGLDADTGSYYLAKESIQQHKKPDVSKLRIEEFVNAGQYQYPSHNDDDLQLNHSIVKTGINKYLLRIGIQARTGHQDLGRRMCLVVDRSGSMGSENRLNNCQQALHHVVNSMQDQDQIAIVTYAGLGRLDCGFTNNKQQLHEIIADLKPSGQSNLQNGLDVGFRQFDHTQLSDINCVLLFSDGIANRGRRQANDILDCVKHAQMKGVSLFTIGVGIEAYNDELMEQLADKGNGTYHYINANAAYDNEIGHRIIQEMHIVAYNTKAQIRFDRNIVKQFTLYGYNNRKLATRDFYDDRIDGADIPAEQSVTILYEIETRIPLPIAEFQSIGEISLRWQQKHLSNNQQLSYSLGIEDVVHGLHNADYNTRLAAVLSNFAIALQKGDHGNWHALLQTCGEFELRGDGTAFGDLFATISNACSLYRVHRYHSFPQTASSARRW